VEQDSVLKAILQKLGGDYSFIEHLGGGEFSNVYLVKHYPSGGERALKILDYHYLLQRLKKQNLDDIKNKFDEIKRRFIVEARLYEKIDHPNIVKIHDTGVFTDPDEGIEIPYFIMSYVKGSSLADVITTKAPFEVSRVIKISANVLSALEAMHQNNIIHRDIKASNIMIEEATGQAVIIDFGIAKDIVGGTKLTTTGALLGSPAYMAPEQFIDSSIVGPALDIYSFGVVLFEMFTGDTPFKGSNFIEVMNAHRRQPVPQVSSRNPALPAGADLILARAMAKEPGHRYKTASDFLNAVKQIHEVEVRENITKYWLQVAAAVLLAVVLLFMVKPPLQVASDEKIVKERPPLEKPLKPLPKERKKVLEVRDDYAALKQFLQSDADRSQKIEKCRLFIRDYRNRAAIKKVRVLVLEINDILGRMEKADAAEKTLGNAVAAVKKYLDAKYLDANDFRQADIYLKRARELKGPQDKEISNLITELEQRLEAKKSQIETRHGESRFRQIYASVTLANYLEFKKQYPGSIHLDELKKRLTEVDFSLPPDKFWERGIKKNKKGYYEITFGDAFNRHHMVYIPAGKIWMDKYEVSNRQFRRFLKERQIAAPVRKASKFIHDEDEYPAVVHYRDAEAYCKHYGFRLPSIDEWEYAAGKGTAAYPWGEDPPGKDGTWRANFDTLTMDGEKDGFDGTAPVNSFKDFPSSFGLLNMAGNVWEWVQNGILKGGSFFSKAEDLSVKKSRGGRDNDREGFRCVKQEDPGSR
jgi:serine/threonine protein kinase